MHPCLFGSVSWHAKSVIYDEALKGKKMLEHFTPLHYKKANKLQDLNYNALSWKEVCDIVPPVNKELSRSQLKRKEEARVLFEDCYFSAQILRIGQRHQGWSAGCPGCVSIYQVPRDW